LSNNPEKLHDAHILAKHPLPAAGLLGLATLPIHTVLPHDWSVSLAAFILALIGGVYIGFAVLDGRLSRLLMETTVAVAFAVYAAVTFHNAPLWIAFGYILHGLWDATHHSPLFDVKMARWWIPACAAYDIATGAGLFLIWTYF
jgi:hypothetical protein